MGWIIGSMFFVLIIFVVTGFKLGKNRYDDFALTGWGFKKLQLLSLLGFLIMLPGFIASVPANSVGILYSPFKGVNENTLKEGIHFKDPVSTLYVISTEVQTVKLKKVNTQTGDSQFISNEVDIKYLVNTKNAFLVFKQFKALDRVAKELIPTSVKKSMESITTSYNIIDILGASRNDIYVEFEKQLTTDLERSGITLYSVTIDDSDGGKEIEAAIVKEAVAKKAVETAKQELEKTKMQAQKETVEAQAKQNAAKIQAETKIIRANAEAEANNIVAKSLTNPVLMDKYIAKWSGDPTLVTGGNGNGMIFDVSSLLKK